MKHYSGQNCIRKQENGELSLLESCGFWIQYQGREIMDKYVEMSTLLSLKK